MIPSAYDGDLAFADLAGAVESRIASLEPMQRRDVERLLSVFDSAFVRFALAGRLPAFHDASADAQDAWLNSWRESRFGFRRMAYQALHRLVFFTHYSSSASHPSIGRPPPLHERAPLVEWEGPARGEQRENEPVLRASDVSAWQPVTPRPLARATKASTVTPGSISVGANLPMEITVQTHVCVIGSGAGGAVAACRLAEQGHDVVILEEGGWWTPADFTEDEAQMVPRLFAEQGARASDDLSFTLLQGRCAGGGNTVNWLIMLRPDDRVMDEWQRTHGAELLGARDLVPALEQIEAETHAALVPDDAHSPANRMLLDGCARLGWRASAAKINTRDCVRAGTCGLGCRYGARQGALALYLPRALTAGARLFADVRAERIVVHGSGPLPLKRVTAAILDRATNSQRGVLHVEAPIVILAAGAVGTPVLLQRSGLGNDVVGKYLRFHPTTAVFGVHDDTVGAAAGIPQSSVCTEFVAVNGGYGFWIECPPFYPGSLAAAYPRFGFEHRRFMLGYSNTAPFIVLVRDGARAQSQGEVRIGRTGRTRIRYRLGADERKRCAEGIAAAARIQLAVGAHTVHTLHTHIPLIRSEHDVRHIANASFAPNRISLFSAHVNGTCRMGNDPRTSACNASGALYGTRGIFVADGSLFPTAPGVNPQATIMALASLVAERIHAGSS
jgi:choline dehydrogenase-like flavoprotein